LAPRWPQTASAHNSLVHERTIALKLDLKTHSKTHRSYEIVICGLVSFGI
jgi:hypothetical protein